MIAVDCVLDVGAALGEGAVWDDRERVLYWVDINGHTLNRFDPERGGNRAWMMPCEIGCFGLREKGGFVVALRTGFAFFDPMSETLEPIADPEEHLPDNRFNDGTVDPGGRMIAGTMPMGERRPVAAFYRLAVDRTVEKILDGFTVTNGTAFSPDGRIFYFSDSERGIQTIWSCSYDADSGEIGERQVFATTHELAGRPDGGTIDADGCYWMAGVGGWQLVRFTPAGAVDRIVEMPVEKPTKIAFGGPDLDTLFVTSIGEGLSEDERRRQPQAGGLFALSIPGITGVPALRYRG